MKSIIKRTPLPIAGLMLALAALGILVQPYGILYKNTLGLMSTFILILLVTKLFSDSQSVAENLNNPIIASVTPTFSMGLMLLSTYFRADFPRTAFMVWSLALFMHFASVGWFTFKHMNPFKLIKVSPSIFIVYVGVIIGSVTAPAYGLQNLGQIVFWFGFCCYLGLLPLVLSRVFLLPQLPEPAIPLITILAAPASLCLVGYLSVYKNSHSSMVVILAVLSLLTYSCVLVYLPKMLTLKFYPSFSAFTFPLVISATAMKKASPLLSDTGFDPNMLFYIVKFQEILAVLITLYVLIKYVIFLNGNKRKSVSESLGKSA